MWWVSPMHTSVENFDYYVHRKLLCAQSSGSDCIHLSETGSSILGGIPIRIRIQGFKDQKLGKIHCWKNVNFFGSKTTIYLSLCLHKGFPSYRRSLRPSKENIQHFKTWNFLIFLLLRVIFALLDSDPKSLRSVHYLRSAHTWELDLVGCHVGSLNWCNPCRTRLGRAGTGHV
jgi:hypothetical protein